MKKYIFMFMGILMMNALHSQHYCGTSHEDQTQMIKQIEKFNKGDRNNIVSLRDDSLIYVPMQFHLVADDAGEGRVSPLSVLEQWEALIVDYKPGNIYPFLAEDGMNFIDDEKIYAEPVVNGGRLASNANKSAINVFITDRADTQGSLGTTLGFYTRQWDYLVVKKSEIKGATSTLAHELGHYFSLPHTFFGWEGEPYDEEKHGNPLNITLTPQSNQIIELMDGSNCETAADKICDTPPDYNFGFGSSVCILNKIVRDFNGDTIKTQPDNYMGYFIGCPKYVFTQGQWDVVLDDYSSTRRAKIRTEEAPEYVEISEEFEFLAPLEDELETYQYVNVDWEDVEGATHYAIQFTSGSHKFGAVVSESNYVANELVPDEFYSVSVRPFNRTNPGKDKHSIYFSVGDETSVIDESIVSKVNVLPNPSIYGDRLQISIDAHEKLGGDYQILDMNGRLVLRSAITLASGTNYISIENMDMTPGLYFFQLQTAKGSIKRKIVVQ